MSRRVVYRVCDGDGLYLEVVEVECFTMLEGSVRYKQQAIEELCERYKREFSEDRVLEISSRTPVRLGNELRGSKLLVSLSDDKRVSVNVALLASQRFSYGGPYLDLHKQTFREARLDIRLRKTGRLIDYRFGREVWPADYGRYFYEWLFVHAIHERPELARQVLEYDAFSNISFQAKRFPFDHTRAVAVYVLLHKRGLLEKALSSKNSFILIVRRIKLRRKTIWPHEWIVKES